MVSNKRERDRNVSSTFTEKYYVAPWCSSSRIFGKRKFVPRRDSVQNIRFEEKRNIKRKSLNKHSLISSGCRNIILFILFPLTIGLAIHRIPDKIPRDLMPKFLWSMKFISPMYEKKEINEECYHKMRHLSSHLESAEKALSFISKRFLLKRFLHGVIISRKALRVRKTGLYSEYELARTPKEVKEVLIEDAKAVKGDNTIEWGTQLALWGLIPLWRAAPPPDIVLSLRPPTPSDCWPFSGSRGEVIINLASRTRVDRVSVEHVKPDTARSAPRNFTIYGLLTNGTRIKLQDGVYQPHLNKQYYSSLQHKNILWNRIVFKVLSNQGNLRYTCIYRLHLYKYLNSDLI